jgi:RNA-directed DNA polymerase
MEPDLSFSRKGASQAKNILKVSRRKSLPAMNEQGDTLMMQVLKKKLRHHSLTGRIVNEVMLEAFKNVKRNRGAAGIDKVSIGMYEANLTENLDSLLRELKTDTFQPKPLRRKFIPKGGGKFRPLGIPSVKDRVAHEVIRSIIKGILILHNSKDKSDGY